MKTSNYASVFSYNLFKHDTLEDAEKMVKAMSKAYYGIYKWSDYLKEYVLIQATNKFLDNEPVTVPDLNEL